MPEIMGNWLGREGVEALAGNRMGRGSRRSGWAGCRTRERAANSVNLTRRDEGASVVLAMRLCAPRCGAKQENWFRTDSSFGVGAACRGGVLCRWAGGAQNGLYLPNTTETSAGAGEPAGGNATSATYLVVYSAAQLANAAGQRDHQDAAPAATLPRRGGPRRLTISKFDVRMADSPRTPVTISPDLAANMTNPVLVRSGSAEPGGGHTRAGRTREGTPEGWPGMISSRRRTTTAGARWRGDPGWRTRRRRARTRRIVFLGPAAGFTSATSSTATVKRLPTAGPGW